MLSGDIGYLSFVIIIFLATGGIILLFDAKEYEKDGMKKENKAARYAGWLNVSLGILAIIGNWVFQ
ncbi:MAG TPA: CLC_0170 family protein [Bacilli bacterium]